MGRKKKWVLVKGNRRETGTGLLIPVWRWGLGCQGGTHLFKVKLQVDRVITSKYLLIVS